MTTQVETLIKRKIFSSEEEAISELVRDYVLCQIPVFQDAVLQFECKYGMNFQQFNLYLHERSTLLVKKALPTEQLKTLNAAVMEEEDDCLDWKAANEMLENWLGLRQEIET